MKFDPSGSSGQIKDVSQKTATWSVALRVECITFAQHRVSNPFLDVQILSRGGDPCNASYAVAILLLKCACTP